MMTLTCEHVVAVLGNESIHLPELPQKYAAWSKEVERFNNLTTRYVVEPPLQFQFCEYCTSCGEALDTSQHYQVAKSNDQFT
ncbi:MULTISPECIES: hypothetical protein [Vibrio]|uniref:hypothetical protein n=1 Tax=Vibrio TaxID=662 RepID=UPI001186C57D|nr:MULTISPECIES: hypothetical protein [Vibrio]MCZ2802047.1 hypothetical protein [Vibrio alginolyticus]NOH36646.1 hypothetical protein [Vibrio coralliilyticus]